MRKIFVILAAVLLLCSCEEATTNSNNKNTIPWVVVEIDSCEYIQSYSRLAHKGNCKYCRERNREMIKEVLMAIDYE